jgi:hypothetical protein
MPTKINITLAAALVLALAIAAVGALLFAMPAKAYEKGELLVTEGLVCDHASEIDAVITLTALGESLQAALAEINYGTEKPRCFIGAILLSRYVRKVRTFYIKDSVYHVHKIKILGVGMKTPSGVIAQELESPVKQYIVSTEPATGA